MAGRCGTACQWKSLAARRPARLNKMMKTTAALIAVATAASPTKSTNNLRVNSEFEVRLLVEQELGYFVPLRPAQAPTLYFAHTGLTHTPTLPLFPSSGPRQMVSHIAKRRKRIVVVFSRPLQQPLQRIRPAMLVVKKRTQWQ